MEGKKNMDSGEEQAIKNDEIDLLEIVKMIWAGRRIIYKVMAVFLLLGLIIAFGSKVEYEASCKLMPESQEGSKPNLGGLGSLAGLAGINLDMRSSGALTPELYPEIARSVPFILKIWDEPLHFEKKDTLTTSYIFFREIDRPSFTSLVVKYTVGLYSQIIYRFSSKNKIKDNKKDKSKLIRLSKVDNKLLNSFKDRIDVNVDSKSGIISLTTKMPDALAAAELAQLSIDLLTEFISDYKSSKAKSNYDFIHESFKEAEIEFEKSQEKLALFDDHNLNVVTAFAKTEFQRLQNEYNITFEMYKGLATQLEQAKIRVKEETPVFTVLEPIQIPISKSEPKRKIILVIAVLLGLLLGGVTVLAKTIYQKIRIYLK